MESYKLSDFSPSDGIGECEEAIRHAGGKVSSDFYIDMPEPADTDEYREACRAYDYLIGEWDYADEAWRSTLSKVKMIKLKGGKDDGIL